MLAFIQGSKISAITLVLLFLVSGGIEVRADVDILASPAAT